MTKFFQFIRNAGGLYNAEKLLMCGAQFVRTQNTTGVDADTQAALQKQRHYFEADFRCLA